MAAPATKHIGDLNGKWVLNKTLSDPVDAALSLQGVGWMLRKTIGMAAVTIHAKQYTGPAKAGITSPANPTGDAAAAADGGAAAGGEYTHVDVDQTATGGIKGNSEARCLDWAARPHSDWLFGSLEARNQWVTVEGVRSGNGDGGDDPSVALVLKAHDPAFLADGWLDGEEERRGPQGQTLILNYVRNVDKGWSAMQTWGFQVVGGERRYVRNVVCVNGSKMEKLKMVYDYVP